MKLLYYSTSFYANHGGSIQSIEFFKSLKENKSINAFIFPDPQHKDHIIKPIKFGQIRRKFRSNGLLQLISFYRRNSFYLSKLINRLKEINPDVLIIQMDSNFLQIKKIKEEFPNLKICCQINGSPFDEFYGNIWYRNFLIKKQTLSYSISDMNFFISEFSRNRIMGFNLNSKRDKIVYNGTDIKKFFPIEKKENLKAKLNYPNDKLILGYIGTLDFHKKIIRLIEAFAEVEKDNEVFLVIIGDGPAFSAIQNYIRKNKLTGVVKLRGWVDHHLINEHLNCFNIGVHHYANHYMNPLKIYEYLAIGLPVIAPDIPSVNSQFENGQDLLITTNTKQNLVEDILKLVKSRDLRKKLSNSGLRNNKIQKYTWENYTLNVLNYIKAIL